MDAQVPRAQQVLVSQLPLVSLRLLLRPLEAWPATKPTQPRHRAELPDFLSQKCPWGIEDEDARNKRTQQNSPHHSSPIHRTHMHTVAFTRQHAPAGVLITLLKPPCISIASAAVLLMGHLRRGREGGGPRGTGRSGERGKRRRSTTLPAHDGYRGRARV